MSAHPRIQSENADTSLWDRLRAGLGRTRAGLTAGLDRLIRGPKALDRVVLEEIEARLLLADVGVETTRLLVDQIAGRLERHELSDLSATLDALRAHMIELLAPVTAPLPVLAGPARPFVILTVGVNGAGKTTTAGKLAHYYRTLGEVVVLAAGDTFRAAAVEQLQQWGQRAGVAVIAQPAGTDAAAVIFDALHAARARSAGLLIADTAGRLHTKRNLMDELRKIRRAIDKFDPECRVETLLVVDAGTGRNALAQAREFHLAAGLTGLVITKLDGTARGGVIFALARELALPIRFIGVGERPDDLCPFEARPFVHALLAED
ncbi:MAG: signal recognition particle-docking protein FtsY [Gammaproteobacteria bacterium]|nr:signal recognition particle-docking protein FtsY [Gammaproteobacteria bacterium]